MVQSVPAYVNLNRVLPACKDSVSGSMLSSAAKLHCVVNIAK
jgi:hypothetical protein